jgi:hypothetical protein
MQLRLTGISIFGSLSETRRYLIPGGRMSCEGHVILFQPPQIPRGSTRTGKSHDSLELKNWSTF